MTESAPGAWYSNLVSGLGPEDSVASYLIRKGGPSGLKNVLAHLSDEQISALAFDPDFWARRQQIPPETLWTVCVALAGRGFGKALALDTPIPTPTGWSTMGALRVGDAVLDEQGRPCRVTFATEVQHGRTCFDVVFSDGSVVVADAEHRWITQNRRERKRGLPGSVRTTVEIRATLQTGAERMHSVNVAAPLDLPARELPLDPYVFGAWLGDGSARDGGITSADPEIINQIVAAGFPVTNKRSDPRSRAALYSFGYNPPNRDGATGRLTPAAPRTDSLRDVLAGMGQLKNKHVPTAYLRGSAPQRLALLQGLMDTDGHCTPSGHVEFCATARGLADAVFDLAAGLGMKPVLAEDRARLNGKDCGPRYRVTFTPYTPVFRLPRKAARVKRPGAQSARQGRRYIVDVRPRESVPVRCITVDSPRSLFLCGRAYIPTHNTWMGARWVNEKARTTKGIGALVGPTAADVRDTMIRGTSGIVSLAPPWALPRYQPSNRRVTWPNGNYAVCYSADKPDRLRGPNASWAWGDEPASWKNDMEALDQLELILRIGSKGHPPQLLLTGTPRPFEKLDKLMRRPGVVTVRGSTLANRANLDAGKIAQFEAMKNTRWGRQEVMGEMLMDIPGAIFAGAKWKHVNTDPREYAKGLSRRIVSMDPAPTSEEGSDESGIIVQGERGEGHEQIVSVLHDGSMHGSPREWAARAIRLYLDWNCSALVVEVNAGGEVVTTTIDLVAREMGVSVNVIPVRAKDSKSKRAEPVSALAECGRIELVGALVEEKDGTATRVFPKLQRQLEKFTGINGRRDDRADALCWGIHEMVFGEKFFVW